MERLGLALRFWTFFFRMAAPRNSGFALQIVTQLCHSDVTLRVPVCEAGSRNSWRSFRVISRSWVDRNTCSIARTSAGVRPSEPFLLEDFLLFLPFLLTNYFLYGQHSPEQGGMPRKLRSSSVISLPCVFRKTNFMRSITASGSAPKFLMFPHFSCGLCASDTVASLG